MNLLNRLRLRVNDHLIAEAERDIQDAKRAIRHSRTASRRIITSDPKFEGLRARMTILDEALGSNAADYDRNITRALSHVEQVDEIRGAHRDTIDAWRLTKTTAADGIRTTTETEEPTMSEPTSGVAKNPNAKRPALTTDRPTSAYEVMDDVDKIAYLLEIDPALPVGDLTISEYLDSLTIEETRTLLNSIERGVEEHNRRRELLFSVDSLVRKNLDAAVERGIGASAATNIGATR